MTALVLVAPLPAGAGVPGHQHRWQRASWPGFLYGPTHSSYNAAARAIRPAGVASLREVFRWFPPASPNAGNNGLGTTTPAVVNNVAYFGANDGMFYAFSLARRQLLWQQYLGISAPTTCKGLLGLTASPVVAPDPATGQLTVYENAPDGHLWAMNARTGTVVWKSVVALPSATQNTYYAWGSALVTGGEVYVGVSGECGVPPVPGGLVAFNQATGAQTGRWNAEPGQGSAIGVWGTPTVAPDGEIMVPVANSDSDGQPLYAESVAGLTPVTLSLESYWQVPNSERVQDADFGAPPSIFRAVVDGQKTTLVGDCNKNGIYYALRADDLSAGPIWQDRIAAAYQGGSPQLCDAAAVWDGTRLIEDGGNSATIDGVTYPGSVQALDPATGAVRWQTGLPGAAFGSATEDGAGVVAVPVFLSATGATGVYLLDARTGSLLKVIPMPGSAEFSQAVFAGRYLVIGGGPSYGLAVYALTRRGPSISVSPAAIVANGNPATVTVTGTNLPASPQVFVSGGLLPTSVTANSPTSLTLQFSLPATTTPGSYSISVVSPGQRPTADTCQGCLQIDAPPAITSIAPTSVVQGGSGQIVQLNGSGFAPGVRVTSPAGIKIYANFISPQQLRLSVSVASSVAPGIYTIYAINSDGGVARCTNCLTVTAAP